MTAHLPAPANPSTEPLTEWRSTRGLRTALTWMLAADAVAALGLLSAHMNRVTVIDDIKSLSATLGEVRGADDFVNRAGWLSIGLFLATAAVLIVWQWRSAKNNEALGRIRPRLTSGWSIGGWFIPFANLVIPVRAFQDLYQGSDPGVANNQEWRGLRRSSLIGWWWATYLIGNLVTIRRSGNTTLDQLRQADQFAAAGAVFIMVAAILAIFVVRSITERQEIVRAAGQPARAGWYADPTHRFDHRYWNGFDWTRHASYNGEALVDPLG